MQCCAVLSCQPGCHAQLPRELPRVPQKTHSWLEWQPGSGRRSEVTAKLSPAEQTTVLQLGSFKRYAHAVGQVCMSSRTCQIHGRSPAHSPKHLDANAALKRFHLIHYSLICIPRGTHLTISSKSKVCTPKYIPESILLSAAALFSPIRRSRTMHTGNHAALVICSQGCTWITPGRH